MLYRAQVIVEVGTSSTQVSAQQRGVGGEDQANVQLPQSSQDQPCPCQPLMEVVGDDGIARQVLDELQQQHKVQSRVRLMRMFNCKKQPAPKMCDHLVSAKAKKR